VPKSEGSLSAVVVSGGKQYRVSPGDRILVDRMKGEPGAEFVIERVLMVAEGDDLKVGAEALKGLTVTAKVIGHSRGPKIDVLRYKSKKRVRVHRGARADLTAIEILSVGEAKTKAKAKAAKPETADKAETTTAETATAETATAEMPEPAVADDKPKRAPRAKKPAEPKEESE
jgi:large subunit ribosomal protein L21